MSKIYLLAIISTNIFNHLFGAISVVILLTSKARTLVDTWTNSLQLLSRSDKLSLQQLVSFIWLLFHFHLSCILTHDPRFWLCLRSISLIFISFQLIHFIEHICLILVCSCRFHSYRSNNCSILMLLCSSHCLYSRVLLSYRYKHFLMLAQMAVRGVLFLSRSSWVRMLISFNATKATGYSTLWLVGCQCTELVVLLILSLAR